jgi:hypothetical protein
MGMNRESVKAVNRIVSLVGVIYLLHCLTLISNSEIIKYSIYFFRVSLFIFSVSYIIRYSPSLLWLYFPLILYYLLYGIINGNWINFIVLDLLSSFTLIFIFLYSKNNYEYLNVKIFNMFSSLVAIGFLAGLYYLIAHGFQGSTSINERFVFSSDDADYKILLTILKISLLLLPFIWYVSYKKRFFISATFILFLGVSFLALSRADIAGSLLSIIFTIFIGIRERYISFRPKFIATFILFSLVGLIAVERNLDTLNTSYELLKYRIENVAEEVEPRDIEAEIYFDSVSTYELILGKGMGAANMDPFGRTSERGIMMMHRGENNLILKGGIIYLLLIYGMAIIALFKLFRSKVDYRYSWASVILIYLLLERGHPQYSDYFMLLFFCLAISFAFSIKSFKKTNKLKHLNRAPYLYK